MSWMSIFEILGKFTFIYWNSEYLWIINWILNLRQCDGKNIYKRKIRLANKIGNHCNWENMLKSGCICYMSLKRQYKY